MTWLEFHTHFIRYFYKIHRGCYRSENHYKICARLATQVYKEKSIYSFLKHVDELKHHIGKLGLQWLHLHFLSPSSDILIQAKSVMNLTLEDHSIYSFNLTKAKHIKF